MFMFLWICFVMFIFVMFLVVMFMFNYVSMILERWIRKE